MDVKKTTIKAQGLRQEENKQNITVKKDKTFLDKIIKHSIYLLVFLMPLFFLPFSYEKIEYNKQILLWVLAGVAFLAWIARMLFKDKEIRLKKDFLSIAVGGFLAVNLFALIFSKDFNASLWGYFGRYSDSFIGLLSFAAIFYVIVNNQKLFFSNSENKNKTKISYDFFKNGLMRVFFVSVLIAEIILILSAYGLANKIALWLPINTMASFKEGAAMFIVIILNFKFLSKTDILTNQSKEKRKFNFSISQFLNFLFIVISLLSLIILNFKPAWILLVIAMLGWMTVLTFNRIKQSSCKTANILLPLFVIAVSIAFVFNFIPSSKFIPKFGTETRLSAKDSLLVSARSLKDNFAFGSGQGNFLYNFAKFKPISFNNNINWMFRFNKANNYVVELLATTGIIGLIAWIMLAGIAIYISINTSQYNTVAAVIIVLSFFLYSSATLLLFVFWLMLAIVGCNSENNNKYISIKKIFERFPEILLVMNTVFIISVFMFAGFLLKTANKYRANMIYAQISADVNTNSQKYESELQKARNFDKKNSLYPIALARIYLADLKKETKKAPSDQSISNIKDLTKKTLDNAILATELSPNSVAAWELRASVYRDIYFVANDAGKAMLDAFQRAVSLEPANPILATELGKAYSRNGDFDNAAKEFNRALELKKDYEDAKIQLAIIKEKFGKASEAVAELEDIAKSAPNDAAIKFEIGRIQYNKGDIDKAIVNFKKAIEIFPNYSNAIYSLGMCYEKQGDKAQAIAALKKVLGLNPGRKDIEDKIEELKNN